MQDHEILRMATFKLQEAARRMTSLARECHSQSVREHLQALAAALHEQEAQLRAQLDAAQRSRTSGGQTGPTASPPRVKARAAG
jgi:hypothetical protein